MLALLSSSVVMHDEREGLAMLPYAQKRTSASRSTAAAPVEPVDLFAKFEPPSLPRGLLPQPLEDFTFEQGMHMGCDMAGVALGTLVVCGAAIHDDIKLRWTVNPVVHQRFAERAKAEKERRERERQIIMKRAKGASW